MDARKQGTEHCTGFEYILKTIVSLDKTIARFQQVPYPEKKCVLCRSDQYKGNSVNKQKHRSTGRSI